MELRRAIEDGDEAGARDEIRALVHGQGKSIADIAKGAYKIETKNGHMQAGRQLFTGSEDGDNLMLAGFTPEQRRLYMQAQAEHHEQARTFQRLTGEMRPELAGETPAGINPKGLAVVAMKKRNFGAVNTMLQQGEIKPEDLPEIRRRAREGTHQPRSTHQPAYTAPTSDAAPASVPPKRPLWTPPPISSLWDKGQAA